MIIGNRTDKWLPIVGTIVLFRILLFVVELLSSLLTFLLFQVPFEFVRHIIAVLPIFEPIIAVAAAVIAARAIEPWLIQLETTTKRTLAIALTVLALLPWQLQSKTNMWAGTPDEPPSQSQNE